jgi:hypothetical protein
MTRPEALALIGELEKLAVSDSKPLRGVRRCQRDLARARQICASLETAPGPPGLLREKLTSLGSSAADLFGRRSGSTGRCFMLADLHSLRRIVTRTVGDET